MDGVSSFGENAKAVGTLWRALSEEGRAPFAAKALADKQRPVRCGVVACLSITSFVCLYNPQAFW